MSRDVVALGLASAAKVQARVLRNQGTGRWVPAANRFHAPRTVSNSNTGFKFMSGRLHCLANARFSAFKVSLPWYQISATTGEAAVGAGATAAHGIEYPIGTAAGTLKSFLHSGTAVGTVADLGTLESDINGGAFTMPPLSKFRMRSFITPSGFTCYGMPGLNTSGGSMSGYGGAVDQCEFAAAPTDRTQANTSITAYTSDTAMEGVLLGFTRDPIDSILFIGDSKINGSLETSGASGAATAGAGDAVGNCGYGERGAWLAGATYMNISQPGSKLTVWAIAAAAALRIRYWSQYCNRIHIDLGTNDFNNQTLVAMQNAATALGAICDYHSAVFTISTQPPKGTTSDSGATLVGQTPDATNEAKRQSFNDWLRAGNICLPSRVFDFDAIVREPTDGSRWRVDGGAWSTDMVHPSVYSSPLIAVPFAAFLQATA